MTSGLVKVINHGRRESSLGVFVLRFVVYFFPALGYTSGCLLVDLIRAFSVSDIH